MQEIIKQDDGKQALETVRFTIKETKQVEEVKFDGTENDLVSDIEIIDRQITNLQSRKTEKEALLTQVRSEKAKLPKRIVEKHQ